MCFVVGMQTDDTDPVCLGDVDDHGFLHRLYRSVFPGLVLYRVGSIEYDADPLCDDPHSFDLLVCVVCDKKSRKISTMMHFRRIY